MSTASTKHSANNIHGILPAVAATLCIALILAPVAFWQFGNVGIAVVAAFAASILVSICVTAWGAARLARSYPQLAALFSSSGVRMAAPLVIALVIVVARGQIAPVETVYYVIPLYLCMLAVDAATWAQEARQQGSRQAAAASIVSEPMGEAV